MMSSKIQDCYFSRVQDEIAATKGYVDEARAMLETAFVESAPRRRRPWGLMGAAAGAAAAAACVLWMVMAPKAIEATFEGEGRSLEVGSWVASNKETGVKVAFSDGSMVDLDKNSEIRLQQLEESGARLLLERGSVRVSVVHREKTDWRLDVGPYQILVTGTRFSAHWLPEKKAFEVAVTEGTVVVDGPMLADGKSLSKGDNIYIALRERIVEINKRDTYEKIVSKAPPKRPLNDPVDVISTTEPPREEIVEPRVRRIPPAGGSWIALAARGDYAGAVALAERAGFSRVVDTASLKDLMLLGDAARLTRKHTRAAHVYKNVRRRFANTSEASRAAFALGRISFEAHHQYREAARWFKTCYRDDPQGTLAREAFGRLMEALDRAGDAGGAAEAARLYQKRFKNGPHANIAKQILSNTASSQ